jgi:hypothetical protein
MAVAASAAAATQAVTRLDLGFDMTAPGDQVSVPVLLEVPEGVQVGRTTNEVAFPTKILSFAEAKTELKGAKVETAVKADAKNKDLSIVTVTVSSPEAIPTGVVASLVFKVAKDADGKEPVKLGNVARVFGPGSDPRPIEPVEGRDGEVKLSGAPPVIACFFYMH